MKDRCVLCRREKSSEEYCLYHSSAHENLKVSYKHWEDALGMGYTDFLREVAEKSETGIWAKEVALRELEKNQT
jgi:hypothetical protein